MGVRRIVVIPEARRTELHTLAARSREVVALAALVGAVTGLVVAGLERAVIDGMLPRVLDLQPWLIALVPGLGLLVARAIRMTIGRGVGPATSDEYLAAFHDADHRLEWRPMIAKFLASLATLGSGNPMGMEGPSMYVGATVGANLRERIPSRAQGSDRRTMMVAGAAAGVAAIFKAPATGAVFALEVPYKDDLARRMLLPALVASASAYLVFAAINGTQPLFPIAGSPTFSMRDLIGAVAVGIIAGIGARGTAFLLRRAKGFSQRPEGWRITVAAGVVVGTLFGIGRLLTGDSLVLTSGYAVVQWAGEPGHSIPLLLAMFALRTIATSASVAGGGVAGLFVPLVVGGALVGAAIGAAFDPTEPSLFVVIGVASFLGAGYRVPLAAVVFVAETTGRPAFIVPGLLAAVAAELMMGPSSITSYQRATV